MNTTSIKFLGFALAVSILYNLRRDIWWRQAIFLLANLVFLATFAGNWKAYLPLALFVGFGYVAIQLMQHQRWQGLFIPVLAVFILVFTWLKRYTFIPHATLLPFPYLLLGLSYIFFRIMHMVVDARDGTLPKPVGVIPYLNYTLNFASIVSGPIQLYPDFASTQLNRKQPSLTLAHVALALERIIIGFFKLRVLSAVFSAVHQAAITQLPASQPLDSTLLIACVVVASYPLYLYFNFSGFIDVMIGVASLCHLNLPENFNRPFSSSSFLEFWSRWHMTLSDWLKAYVYTPVVKGLMSRFAAPEIAPLLGVFGFFVTFFLVGAWHGQTSEFLFFGLLVGGGVALNKLFQIVLSKTLTRKRYKVLEHNAVYLAFSRGLTFVYFAFSLIWFWCSWTQIHQLAMALTFTRWILVWLALWLGGTTVLAVWEKLRASALQLRWDGTGVLLSPPVRIAWAAYLAILTLIALSQVNLATPVLYQIF